MNEAAKRPVPQAAATHYLLSVTGLRLPMGAGERPGQSKGAKGDAASPAERQQMMMNRLKESATLERKGKDPVHAESVQAAQQMLVFFFPRKDGPIDVADKEVTFQAKMGPMTVKAKFALKDMLYEGKLEL